MSIAMRITFLLAAVSTISLVRTWPQTNADAEIFRQKQRQTSSGHDRNISRNQPYQSTFNSEEHGGQQTKRNNHISPIGFLSQHGSNQSDVPIQTLSRNSQLNRQAPWPDLNHQRAAPVQNSEQYIHVPVIPENNVSFFLTTNKQSLSTEMHAVTRGNRRVAANTSAVRAQALSNSKEEFDKPEESKFQTDFPKVSFSDRNQDFEIDRVLNNTRTLAEQGQSQPSFQSSQSNVELSPEQSYSNIGVQSSLVAQGRIISPVDNRRTRPDTPTDDKNLEGQATLVAGISSSSSSSEFKGDSSSSNEASGGAIVFPDTKFKPIVTGNKPPACAQGNTFCTEAENYPVPHLSSVLKNEINYHGYFGVDKEEVIIDPNIKPRIGPDDGEPLCRYEEKLIFPKIAKNKDDDWMFVVNLDEEYVQGVRIELCVKAGSPCQLSEGFPPGYTTSCRQKYVYRKLLAVGSDGRPAPDSFKLPSCCACYYSKTPLGNRILNPGNNSTIPKSQGSTITKLQG